MTLLTSDDENLVDFFGLGQVAAQNFNQIDQENLCDNAFDSLTQNINQCQFLTFDSKITNLKNTKELMLRHLNV